MARRLLAPALVLVLLALGIAVPAADAQTPKRGGVLRIAEREAPSLDPHLSISFLTHSHMSMVKHHDGYGLGMRLLFTWIDK